MVVFYSSLVLPHANPITFMDDKLNELGQLNEWVKARGYKFQFALLFCVKSIAFHINYDLHGLT